VRRLAPDGLEASTQVIERGYEGYVVKDAASVYERRSVFLHEHQGIVDARAAIADPVHLPEAIDNQRLCGVSHVSLRDAEMTGKAGEAPREREVFAYRLSDTFRELSLLNRPVSRRLPVGVNG
jgi:hypothetical protein